MVRVTEDIRWDASRVQRVAGTPLALTRCHSEPIEESDAPHRGPDLHQQDDPDDEDNAEAPFKRMPIHLRDLQVYQYTPGCQHVCTISVVNM